MFLSGRATHSSAEKACGEQVWVTCSKQPSHGAAKETEGEITVGYDILVLLVFKRGLDMYMSKMTYT